MEQLIYERAMSAELQEENEKLRQVLNVINKLANEGEMLLRNGKIGMDTFADIKREILKVINIPS